MLADRLVRVRLSRTENNVGPFSPPSPHKSQIKRYIN